MMRFFKLNSLMTVCGAALLCTTPLLAQAEPKTSTSAQGTKRADRLMRDMKADAQTIETHAAKLEMLAKDPNAQWMQFDREWNDIKPAQEMLQSHMRALDSMRASLSDQQRKTLDQTKQASSMIATRTRELLKLIDQPGADLKTPTFRSYAQSLAKNAETVAKSTASGV